MRKSMECGILFQELKKNQESQRRSDQQNVRFLLNATVDDYPDDTDSAERLAAFEKRSSTGKIEAQAALTESLSDILPFNSCSTILR